MSENNYKYFIDTIRKEKAFWLLQTQDGLFAMFEDDKGQEYLPIWPTEETALLLVKDDWAEYIPECMPIKEFFEWESDLTEDAIVIAAFPNEQLQVMSVTPKEFKQQLLLKTND